MQKHIFKENTSHGTSAFPLAVYDVAFDRQQEILASLHYHSEIELLLVTQGCVSVQIENETYHLEENEGLLIEPNRLHMILADNSKNGNQTQHFIAVVFDYHFLCSHHDIIYSKYIQPLLEGQLQLSSKLSVEVCQAILKINQAYHASLFGCELFIKEQLLHSLHLMVQTATPATTSIPNSKNKIVRETIDYIETNYDQPITLQNLADHVHISKEYLCRIFSQMSQVSPITYLNRFRIQQSTNLLLETDKSITEIAHQCGFNHSSYFNKLFLAYMNCTPSEYRKGSNHSPQGKHYT